MAHPEAGDDSADLTVPVLVVGAGPVGMALAIELGRMGVDCLLIERRDGAVPVPKMSQVSARNMEFCRRWGIAEAVKTAVWPGSYALDFVYMTSLTGEELARQKVPSYAKRGDLGFTPEGPCHCPQIYFDPILAKRVHSLPSVTVRYNTALEGFGEDADGVRAQLVETPTGRRFNVRAKYLVGCDGPGGAVRPALGIAVGGLGVVANSANIFFRSPELASLHDKGWARFYRAIDDTGCWAELIAIDGQELWRLTVFDDPSPEIDVDACLRRVAGRDFPYEVISATPWERRDVVIESYGHGRVTIAGDAAHQCSPTGGLGMHTGVEDAVNLAWKLAALVQGWGGAHLLASYEAERRPIAARNVGFATMLYRQIRAIPEGRALTDSSDAGARQRQNLAVMSTTPGAFSLSEFTKAQYCYEGSPICVWDAAEPPRDATFDTEQSARPGTRAPHAWIGEGRSTLDLFGDGFTLLRLGAAPPDASALTAAAAAARVPVTEVAIADPAIAALYAMPLVLVRPDGHVAWRANAVPADARGLIDRLRGAA